MILIPLIFTFIGVAFMRDYAKYYNPKDSFASVIPATIATIILVLSGVLWTFYFIDTI